MRPNRILTLILLLSAFSAGSLVPAQNLYDANVLRTFALRFSQPNYWQLLLQNRASETYIKADLTVDRVTYKDVGVRFRGNSSFGSSAQKKPFKISMDAFVPGRKLYGHKTLNLNNGTHDPTFMRTKIAHWVLGHFMPAPRVNWVKLTLNDQNWGIYVHVEQVNKDLLRDWFQDEDGNRYKAEPTGGSGPGGAALTWLGTNVTPYRNTYQLKNENAVSPHVDVIDLCNKLNNSGQRIMTELPKVLDVDEALRYLVGVNLLPSLDSYIHGGAHNYYLYADPYHGRFSLLPWDMNNSVGAYPFMSIQQSARLDPFYKVNDPLRPLLNRVLPHVAWRERYVAHYRSILNRVYDWTVIGKKVSQWQSLIESEVDRDTKKLYPTAFFRLNVAQDVSIGFPVGGLEPYIKARSRFLRNHPLFRRPAPQLSAVAHTPASPTTKDTVQVTVTAGPAGPLSRVTLHHRARGPFTAVSMFDDGKHGDGKAGDGVFGAAITPQAVGRIEYYVEAQNIAAAGSTIAFLPEFAGFSPAAFEVTPPRGATTVWLNEFVAKNDKGLRDEKGEREDWIELVNGSGASVDLSGKFLTDDITNPRKWSFPSSTLIPGGQTLLVWADDEPTEGPLHATFKLNRDGELVALFDSDGTTLLDVFRFDYQQADVSTGRVLDAKAPWVTFASPTPNTLNLPAGCGTRNYSALDPTAHTMNLGAAGTPKLGTSMTVNVMNGLPRSTSYLLFGGAPANLPVGSTAVRLLFAAPILLFAQIPMDSTGAGAFKLFVPRDQRLAGQRVYWQAFGTTGTRLLASDGLETTVCP